MQTTFTFAKTGGAGAADRGSGSPWGGTPPRWRPISAPAAFAGAIDWTGALVVAFGTAMVGSLFSSSSAWNNVTFAAAEVREPRRNLPRALLFGTLLVTVLYVLANLAYLNVLPLAGAKDGADVMARGIQYATQDRVGTAAAEVDPRAERRLA